MSCRDEILNCVHAITSQKGSNEFTIEEILDCMRARGTEYSVSTIRTHITSRLCVNAPAHHAVRYPDLERTAVGTYRLTTAVPAAPNNPEVAVTDASSSKDAKSFQRLAARILSNHFNTELRQEEPIPIGKPPKLHKFDLACPDHRYVGECKSYSWTEAGNIPSAKIAITNEAVFFLSFLPLNATRFVVMRKHESPTRRESLAAYYYRTYRHLLGGVLLFELDEDSHILAQVVDALGSSSRSEAEPL